MGAIQHPEPAKRVLYHVLNNPLGRKELGNCRDLVCRVLFLRFNQDILLLGAGGAARGISFALGEALCRSVTLWNRSPDRAYRLLAELTAAGVHAEWQGSPDPWGFDCIVNCTSVGMEGTGTETASACDFARARPEALAVDIVYKPEATAFLNAARNAGLRTLGGLPMLIYQGALAFELWTGVRAPVDVMFEAARQRLREQSR